MPVLDERLIAKSKALRKRGMTQEEIAVELGVTQGAISRILRQHGLGGKLIHKAEGKLSDHTGHGSDKLNDHLGSDVGQDVGPDDS